MGLVSQSQANEVVIKGIFKLKRIHGQWFYQELLTTLTWWRHQMETFSALLAIWRGALMSSLICTRTNGWVNNGEAGDLRRHRAHYDVTVTKKLNLLDALFLSQLNSRWCLHIIFACRYLRDIGFHFECHHGTHILIGINIEIQI